MRPRSYSPLPALLLIAIVALMPRGASAQRGDASPLEQLQQEDVQTDLKLTAEQLQQLEAIRTSLNDRSGFAELMRKSREVESEQERNQLREQMRNYASTRRQQAEAKLAEVLSEAQLTRLGQISLQQQGLRALTNEPVAEQLKLTDEQKQQIAKLSEERQAARSDDGAELDSDDQREQFRSEWDTKYTAVLNPEQRAQWTQMTGPPMAGQSNGVVATASGTTPAAQAVPVEIPPAGADVVASFGTASKQPVAQSQDEGKLYFNFRYAPWADVLQLFAEAADLTLDLNTVPPGSFSHFDSKGYTVTEALDVLNGYLLARGYVLVRREGDFLVCVRIDAEGGIPPNLVPTVSVEELPTRGRNEMLTVVFPLGGEPNDVDAVATEVEKLVGPQGKVVGVKPTRSLVVTDIGSNLTRINHLLKNVTGGPEELIFHEYQLEHILADDAEFLVRTLLGLSIDATATSSTPAAASNQNDQNRGDRNSRFGRFGGGFPFGGQQPSAAPTTSGAATRSASRANTIADPRTNKLLVSATPAEHRIIEEALRTIDVAERSPLASDRPFGSLGDKQMSVISLSNMDPTSAAMMLQTMFLKDAENAPTISADLLGRQLIVRGSEAQLYQIKQLLMELGEDGSGQRQMGNRGPVRTFNLSGRDPSEFLPILERMWAAQRGSTLKVIVPGEDEATRRRAEILRDVGERDRNSSSAPSNEPPTRERPQRPDDVSDPINENDDSRARRSRTRFDDAFAVFAEGDEPVESQRQGTEQPSMRVGDITVRVIGGELMLMSQDQEALDELELMIEQVMQAVPPRTTWSIFPLKSADATEAAAMLEQLFPDSRVSQTASSSGGTLGALTSGVNSFASGVAGLTGLSELGTGPQTLRIIPETRLNALWVSGPTYKVKEVEEMLSIIDSAGLTDSMRDRLPRLIPVQHADIDDVYEIVKSVYAPEMQGAAAGGDPRQAFAAMLGGGGRRGGDDDNNKAQQAEPKVTLGVDRDTSHLIVSADEGTFLEIEELVNSIDVASQQARRTVMVRPLVNTNASMLQESLTSIIPKVTVSTSSSSSRPQTSTSSSSSGNTPSSGGSDEDTQRRMEFFRRMREQGGGGSPFGGGGGDRGGRGGRGGSDGGGRGGSGAGGRGR